MAEKLRDKLPLGGIGSNAVALGKAATDNGRGMLLGNPHFPWDGSERFYQSQLEVPGKMKVQGASLLGVPLINIGHTEKLAWSHTVSTAYRFTPFEERLVPGSTTTYMYDGQPKEMTRDKVTVDVGGGKTVTRTLYSTQHGPIFTSLLGLPLFPWTPVSAYAMGDANAGNFRYLNHFLDTNKAQSADELLTILKRNQGIPWVNTIAADSQGRALYADISVVPAVPDAKRDACVAGPLGVVAPALLGLPVLDGSRSECEWDVEPDALQKGIFGPAHMPALFRDDYVTNSNDSYWLSNPAQPLEGFARIIGAERTTRALRTRSGLVMVAEKLANGGKFGPVDDLQNMLFSNRQYYAELVRPALVDLCKANPTINGVDVSAACPALEKWDGRDNLGSRGALLFRRFASRVLAAPAPGTGSLIEPLIYTRTFSASDPVNTPSGLNASSPLVRNALADAVTDLRVAGIPLDAPLGDFQYEMRGDEKIPIHGGPGTVGLFNAINVGWNAQKGYPDVPHGTSFVQTVKFDGDRCPQSEALLTYSLSTSPESKHFADQTRAYSRKEWIPMLFCAAELRRDKGVRTTELPGKAKAKKRAKAKAKAKPRS
jgi:acyl-homoserine-lactone acylase